MTVQELRGEAQRLGFSALGVVPAQPSPRLSAYLRWLEAGMHGEMGYLARPDRTARRRDLNVILPGARTLLVAVLDYKQAPPAPQYLTDPTRGRIASYAWAEDYHKVMLPRLQRLAGLLEERAAASTRTYVDTGAILERSHAEQAGLGFTGKNTMLIHPSRGSYFFIGEIITDLDLPHDPPPPMPGCGTCTRCLNACPTDAFPEPYVLDGRRCISYLTIEFKGYIPHHLRPLMGNWVYGCDICQEVCPWQRFSPGASEAAFIPGSSERTAPLLVDLLRLNDERFNQLFAGSAIERIKCERLVRNACIAAGNSGSLILVDALEPLLGHHSGLVRAHAAWALLRLTGDASTVRLALKNESDENTAHDISLALEGG